MDKKIQNEPIYFSMLLNMIDEKITSENREHFRNIIVSMIKLRYPELSNYVLRIDDLQLSRTHNRTKMLLSCYYTKSILNFSRL
jgi:flagellar biosynthesis regulator FlbT